MPYAINPTNDGWRSINSEADLLAGETFSATQPVLPLTKDDLYTYANASATALLSISGTYTSGGTLSGAGRSAV